MSVPTPPARTSVNRWRDDEGHSTTEDVLLISAWVTIGAIVLFAGGLLLSNENRRTVTLQGVQSVPTWVWGGAVAVVAVMALRVWLRKVRPTVWLDDDVLHVRRHNVSVPLADVRGVVYGIEPAGNSAYEYLTLQSVDPQFEKRESIYQGSRRVHLSAHVGVHGGDARWLGSVGFDELHSYPQVRRELARYIDEHRIPCNVDIEASEELGSTLPPWTDDLPVARIGS